MSRGRNPSIAVAVLASCLLGTSARAIPYALTAKLSPVAAREISPVLSKEAAYPSLARVTVRPETVLKMGTYDPAGNKDGSKELTAAELWKQLDEYDRQTLTSSTAPAVRTTEYDAELGTTIEVLRVPQEASLERSLAAQRFFFDREAVQWVVPRIEESPDRQAAYFKIWGRTDRFAAYIDTGYTTHADRNSRGIHAKLAAGGYALRKKVDLVDFETTVNEGEGTSYSYVALLGSRVWSSSSGTPVYSASWTREASKRQRFMIGPVPVSVGAAVGGRMGLYLSVSIPQNQPHTIAGTVIPSVAAYGKADASVDLWIARAGVEGSLNIITVSTPATLYISYVPDDHSVDSRLKADLNLSSLNGKVSIYAKIKKPWPFSGWKKWSKEIFSWDGFHRSWNLIDETVSTTI